MSTIRISGVAAPISTLGPGRAAVIWLQGCDLACRGCMSEDTWPEDGGSTAAVADVAAWLDSTDLRHLTLSGGEPMAQAAELVDLLDLLDPGRWVVTCYTGHTIESLRARPDDGPRELIARLDLLIDGPYVQGRHDALRWRGSTNQRLHLLSDRVSVPDDRSAGLSVWFDEDGSFRLVGVPDRSALVEQFVELAGPELELSDAVDPTPVPFPTLEVT